MLMLKKILFEKIIHITGYAFHLISIEAWIIILEDIAIKLNHLMELVTISYHHPIYIEKKTDLSS